MENEPILFLVFFFVSMIIITIGAWYGDKTDGSSKETGKGYFEHLLGAWKVAFIPNACTWASTKCMEIAKQLIGITKDQRAAIEASDALKKRRTVAKYNEEYESLTSPFIVGRLNQRSQ